jgi:hypothetical protein
VFIWLAVLAVLRLVLHVENKAGKLDLKEPIEKGKTPIVAGHGQMASNIDAFPMRGLACRFALYDDVLFVKILSLVGFTNQTFKPTDIKAVTTQKTLFSHDRVSIYHFIPDLTTPFEFWTPSADPLYESLCKFADIDTYAAESKGRTW